MLSLDELRMCGLTRKDDHGTRSQRASPSPLPRGLRRGPHQPPTGRPLPRRRQGMRPNRRPQPLLGRRPLRARPLGRPIPRGDDPTRTARSHGHPRPPLLEAKFATPLATRASPSPPPPAPSSTSPPPRLPRPPTHRPRSPAKPRHRPARSSRHSTASDPAEASPTSRRSSPPATHPPAASSRTRCWISSSKPVFERPDVNRPITTPGPPHHPRLPLAGPAPGDRGRRRRMARRPPHPRGRRRAPGHPRSPRRARDPRHLAQAITHRTQTLERIRAAGAPT